MKKPSFKAESLKKNKRVFFFENGSVVEIYWHVGRREWAGEAHLIRKFGLDDFVWSGVVLSIDRRDLPKLLRMRIAKKLNPRLSIVHDRIIGADSDVVEAEGLPYETDMYGNPQ